MIGRSRKQLAAGARSASIGALTTLLVLSSGWALAQSTGGDYQLRGNSVTSGGGRAQGGQQSLQGTIGRVDASDALTGGDYTLIGGIREGTPRGNDVFEDGFE